MTWRINRYRCSRCGCDEPIHNAIDGKLYCNNCGMRLENSSVTNRNKTDSAVERVSKCRVDTESDDTVLEKIVARLRGEFTNLIPDERPDAIVYNMGYAAAIRDLEHIVEEVIAERRDNSGGDGKKEGEE